MTADSLIRMAYAQLRGLQDNIPERSAPGEFIELYHQVVDDLESLGGDLSRFRVPGSAIQHRDRSSWCSSSFLSAKVDGLLNLFNISKDKIGFIPPK